jgi:hypothetical protein
MTLVKSLYSGDPDVIDLHDRWCYSVKVSPVEEVCPGWRSQANLSTPSKSMCQAA